MESNESDIKKYYDNHLKEKLTGFLNGNERVERAWQTLTENIQSPSRILEIGCGIGDISVRMSRFWNNASVTGFDISPKSIDFAKKLFASERVTFIQGNLAPDKVDSKFDLIVLMDVFEHIRANERPDFQYRLRNLVSHEGFIFLSFPTPRHLAWLKDHIPTEIQPVDEDISIDIIAALASSLDMSVLLYKEVSVWHQGDYAHCVIGNRSWRTMSDRKPEQPGIKHLIKNRIKAKYLKSPKLDVYVDFSYEEKVALLKSNLGIQAVDEL